jgi:hypothetical protein
MSHKLALAFLIFSYSCFLALQTSHRQLNPKSPRDNNPFDQLEKQGDEASNDRVARLAAARIAREKAIAQLQSDLPRLIELAQGMQDRLKTLDANASLPADLTRDGEQLEGLARKIHRQIPKL